MVCESLHAYQRRVALCVVTLTVILSSSAWAESAVELAKRLSTLRGEVESLSSELSEKQADYRSQLQGFARQEADLGLEARRGETAIGKLRLAISTIRKKNAEVEDAGKVLDPVIEFGLGLMEQYVDGALPFKKKSRLKALSEIRKQRKANTLSADQALNRLWASVEDELRMQRESVLYRQEVLIDGDAVLADVLRVGMVMMFYRVKDRGVGFTQRTQSGWSYVKIENPEHVKQLELAFEQFRKQVRVGTFVLPNQLGREVKP